MVGLRNNRKGMIAIFDALVFLALLSIVAIGLFSYTAVYEEQEPMAKTVSDQLYSIDLKANELCQYEDNQVEHIYMLIAVNMNDDNLTGTEEYIRSTLDMLIPEYYGYDLHIEYNGNSFDIVRDSDRGLSSQYIKEMEIGTAGTMISELRIY